MWGGVVTRAMDPPPLPAWCTWEHVFVVHELLVNWWDIPVSRVSFLSYLASEPSEGYIVAVSEEEVETQWKQQEWELPWLGKELLGQGRGGAPEQPGNQSGPAQFSWSRIWALSRTAWLFRTHGPRSPRPAWVHKLASVVLLQSPGNQQRT